MDGLLQRSGRSAIGDHLAGQERGIARSVFASKLLVLFDQGLPRSAVELLRADGWDAVDVIECGPGSARDEQILGYARGSGYVVCTLDADVIVRNRIRSP